MLQAIKSFEFSRVANDTSYTIVAGSILTCNVEDYETFWASAPVQRRLGILNDKLKPEIKKFCEVAKTETKAKHVAWNRQMTNKSNKSKLGKSEVSLEPTLDDWMRGFRAAPLCTVRNRGIYFHYGSENFSKPQDEKSLEIRVYEKKYESNIDLTMGVIEGGVLSHGNMITEWMANHPSSSTYNGDKQKGNLFETNARFDYSEKTYKHLDIGVEIDLDHKLQRLRRTVAMNQENGADLDNYPVFKQFIPSAGMQIQAESVSTDASSVIFNADGFAPVFYENSSSSRIFLDGETGEEKSLTCGSYTFTYQEKWSPETCLDEETHYSHSQIAFTTPNSSIDGYNNELGTKNKVCQTYEKTGCNGLVNNLTNGFSVTSVPVIYNARSLSPSSSLPRSHFETIFADDLKGSQSTPKSIKRSKEPEPLFCCRQASLHIYEHKNEKKMKDNKKGVSKRIDL